MVIVYCSTSEEGKVLKKNFGKQCVTHYTFSTKLQETKNTWSSNLISVTSEEKVFLLRVQVAISHDGKNMRCLSHWKLIWHVARVDYQDQPWTFRDPQS